VAVLKSAASNAEITTDPASTILTKFQNDWGVSVTPTKTLVTWSRSFSNLSKTYAVIVKDFMTESPAQILGSQRYRYGGTYKVHVVAKGTSLDDALDKMYNIQREITRIVQTQVTALSTSGFDEWEISPFRKIETGNDSLVNSGQAGDSTVLVRSVADLRLIYDMFVSAS
jgi:hypothetical protein